jgi:thymidylate synthase
LLTHIIARECNLDVGDFIHTIGDAHIYLNHIEQVKEQLSRKPYNLPTLHISNSFNLTEGLEGEFDIDTVNMFILKNYLHHPTIKMDMAV